MRKIECDFCGKTIVDERNIWCIQIPFLQKNKIMVNGKEVGQLPSHLSYKTLEICPNCAIAVAKSLDKELRNLGVEI